MMAVMEWNSEYNKAVAICIVFALVPVGKRLYRWKQDFLKANLPDGIMKWLLTHEFGRGHSEKP